MNHLLDCGEGMLEGSLEEPWTSLRGSTWLCLVADERKGIHAKPDGAVIPERGVA